MPPRKIEVVSHVAPMSAAFNCAQNLADGEFHAIVDADMVLDPHCFRTLVHMLWERPKAFCAFGDLRDDMIERPGHIKVFRTAITRQQDYRDEYASELGYRDFFLAHGWEQAYTPQTLGVHHSMQGPAATFQTFRYRGHKKLRFQPDEVPGFVRHLAKRCAESRDPERLIALVAFCHGLLAHETGDNDLRSYVADEIPQLKRAFADPHQGQPASPERPAWRRSRWRRLGFGLAAASMGVVLALLATEALVRLTRSHYTLADLRNQSLLYQGSIFSRHQLLRQQRTIRDIPHPESMAIRINARGFRGEDFQAAKPPGVTRIVFLGGSSVFGYRLKGLGSDWPHRVQKLLRSSGLAHVECLNAGVPGHATFDSLGRLVGEIHLYAPDWIVLYQCHNDLKYFTWLSPEDPPASRFRPFRQKDDPRITFRNGLDRLLCSSQIYTKLRTAYYTRKVRGWRTGGYDASARERPTRYGLRQYRLDVELICDAARNIGARTLLVSQAHKTKGLDAAAPWRALRMSREDYLAGFSGCASVLREVAESKPAEFLDASAVMSGRPEHFIDVVHLTPAGARRLAELVTGKLRPLVKGAK